MSDLRLSIILPAYKEKENLAVLVPQIIDGFRDIAIEIIVVDDHSMDGTRELMEGFKTTNENVILLERAGLMGIGSAIRDGYNLARGEYILSSDADRSFSVADMRRLYERIVETGDDMVLGYRVNDRSLETEKHGMRAMKSWFEDRIVSPMSNRIIGFVSGMGLKNYNTDFRVLRATAWKKIRTVENRQFFLFETILNMKRSGAKISEIPVTFSPRQAGDSKVSFFKQAPGYLWKLIRMVHLDRNAH